MYENVVARSLCFSSRGKTFISVAGKTAVTSTRLTLPKEGIAWRPTRPTGLSRGGKVAAHPLRYLLSSCRMQQPPSHFHPTVKLSHLRCIVRLFHNRGEIYSTKDVFQSYSIARVQRKWAQVSGGNTGRSYTLLPAPLHAFANKCSFPLPPSCSPSSPFPAAGKILPTSNGDKNRL